MKQSFFSRMALTNIKNNRRTYLPYAITCTGIVLMFYNLCAIIFHSETGMGSFGVFLLLGAIITAIFVTVFIFYINSFLVKRRKKEFGLLNMLGLEKRHIGCVIMWETVYVGFGSILAGLGLGILFNKLITLLLFKILDYEPAYKFQIVPVAVILTVLLFCFIFMLTLISSLWQVSRAKPVQLLQGSAVGEKEPKANWFIALIGFATLGTGYAMALMAKNAMEALLIFFLAAVLVLIGTYCLFTAGSILLLKILKKNKNYYYQTKHFISLSSMIYRMKKNAVGLANICVMSTAVLVMLSTTVSLYLGMGDILSQRYPKEAAITVKYAQGARPDLQLLETKIQDILNSDGMQYTDFTSCEYVSFTALHNDNKYVASDNYSLSEPSVSVLVITSAPQYSRLTGQNVSLKENEALVYASRDIPQISIFDKEYSATPIEKEPDIGFFRAYAADVVYVVVSSDEDLMSIFQKQYEAYGDKANSIECEISFNFNAEDNEVLAYCEGGFEDEVKGLSGEGFNVSADFREFGKINMYILYGSLFFVGVFLGTLFLIATVLIMYYKQVVEGFEDRERFKIMQNVGLSKAEVKKSIGSQVLTVFILPLAAAVIHVAVAFPVLTKLLAALQLTNIPLFAICTVVTALVFAAGYAVVYVLTSRVYYKIVNG